MGVMDKFISAMKLSEDEDDGYYDDDFYDDDDFYEDDYEERPRRSFSIKRRTAKTVTMTLICSRRAAGYLRPSSNVTPMRQPSSRRSGGNNAGMEVCVVKPISVDDSREITETLLSGRTVILNLEGMDLEIAQRIIDFISGATFAISGNLQKISNDLGILEIPFKVAIYERNLLPEKVSYIPCCCGAYPSKLL